MGLRAIQQKFTDISEESTVSIFRSNCNPNNQQINAYILLDSYFAYNFTLKMEATVLSDTSVNTN
jgi:hypothetical protein